MYGRKKRRTQSAADIELTQIGQNFNQVKTTSKSRRKSNARQARLIAFPQYLNAPIQNIPQNPYCACSNTPTIYPPMQVTKDSILLSIVPVQLEMTYSFNIDKSNVGFAILTTSQNIRTLTFSFNRTLFTNITPPIDITNLICNGSNIISFSTYGIFSTFFVEIKLKDVNDTDMIIKRIINEFPAAPNVEYDPYSTMVCPISNNAIETPARGVHCNHYQCFDLKTFVQRAKDKNDFTCPICGSIINFEDLRCVKDYMNQMALKEANETDSLLFSSIADSQFDPFDNEELCLENYF